MLQKNPVGRLCPAPTIVIDGRYLTNPSMVADATPGLANQEVGPATLKVIDALVEQAKRK